MRVRHAHQTVLANDPAKDISATVWNADHELAEQIVNADVSETAAIAESKLALNNPTHAEATAGSGIGVVGQEISNTDTGSAAVATHEGTVSHNFPTAFLALTDTPDAYTGDALKIVRVNAAEDALEFVPLAGGGDMLAATYDPTSVAGDAFDTDNHASGTINKVFTATEQSKLSGIAEGAEVNVNADWNAGSGDAQILNKPTLFSGAYADLSGKPTIPDELADLTADATHRIVTDAEKSTWNAKYGSGDSPSFADVTVAGLAGAIITSESIESSIEELDDSMALMTQTGFGAWTSGADADTWTITGGKFQIDRTGYGYISGKKITWASGLQTGVLSANNTHWIYVDTDGLLYATTTHPTNKIKLFEVLYDGTTYVVAKENHPYTFNSAASGYLHNNVGTTIRGTGAIATRVATGTGASADDRRLKIVGADTLDDHGLSTAIADSAGAAVSWMTFYLNGSGKWIMAADQTPFLIQYNNAGTPTNLDAVNAFAVCTLYVAKDSIESTIPCYCALMDDAVYTTLLGAQGAISGGNVTYQTNEMKSFEHAQLGYVIVQYSATGGYIAEVQIVKSTFNQQLVGGAAGSDHALMSNLPYADSGHTGFEPAKGTDDNFVTDTEKTKLSNISITQAVDLDTLESDTVTNNAKISFDSASSTKLAGIAAGAEVNINADWNAGSGDALIQNKPSIPTQYTDELAQDAIAAIIDTSLVYVDDPASLGVAQSSEILAGKVELATAAEVVTGTDTGRACTPAGIAGAYTQTNIAAMPGADHTSIGQTMNALNAGGTITLMDLVVLNSSSQWVQTDANAAATYAGALAISLESKTSGQAMKVALPGSVVRDDTWAWTPGAVLYLSETAGQITETQPVTADAAIRVIGFALTADVICFNPSVDFITHI